LVKNGGVGMLFTMSSIDSIFSIFIKFEQQGGKTNNEKKKQNKWRNEQPCTLTYTLILQTMSFHLSSCFLSKPISFLQNDAM
jgi:hypothetical protein